MTSDDETSVTQWIKKLGSDQRDEGIRRLWERYFPRLVQLAEARLRAMNLGSADGEDIALSAFESFFRGATAGRFPDLGSRDDLWKLLVTITARRALNRHRRERAQKRGGGRVKSVASLAGAKSDSDELLLEIVSSEPTPEFAAMVAEEFKCRLESLDDPALRQIAIWKMDGLTNDEIGERIDRAPRTVANKVKLIRQYWENTC
jgi:DNA-directed RNA polymerase specialized sigma24 family protein